MQDLITQWRNTRQKSIRFEILNNASCPEELILKAFELYPPDEIFNIPTISVKYIFNEFNSKTLKKFWALKTQNFELVWPPESSKYHNLLMYLEFIYNPNTINRCECLLSIFNSKYLKRIKSSYSTALNNCLELAHSNYQPNSSALSWAKTLFFHLYSQKVITGEDLKAFIIQEPNPPKFSISRVDCNIDHCMLINKFVRRINKESSKDLALFLLKTAYVFYIPPSPFLSTFRLNSFMENSLDKFSIYSLNEVLAYIPPSPFLNT